MIQAEVRHLEEEERRSRAVEHCAGFVEGEEPWRTYWRDARLLLAMEDTNGVTTRSSVHWPTPWSRTD